MHRSNCDISPAADPRIEFFDRLAQDWDASEQEPDATVAQIRQRSKSFGLRPGEDLLEVGCGTGQLTGWLAEQVRPGRVMAIDFSREMLRKAVAKNIPAVFQWADVCTTNLGEAQFDAALCFHSFPHFRDPAAALRNLARCLKPSGRLMVVHLNSRDEINAFHCHVGGVVGDDLLPSEDQWRELLDAAGFMPPDIEDNAAGYFLRTTLRRQAT